MRQGTLIGRIFGIDLKLDASWLVMAALVVWTLTAVFGQWHPSWTSGTVLVVAIVTALGFFASLVAHELAHALVARSYGLGVREITLHLFGGVARLDREPPTPRAELLIAVVGPVTSVALGLGMLALAPLVAGSASTHTLLAWLGPVNIGLGVFNLLPGFPMDGGRILRAALWKATGNFVGATRWTAMTGQAVGFAFIGAGAAMAFGLRIPLLGTGLGSGLWLALIGMFVRRAAQQHQASAEVRGALEGVTVASVMRPRPAAGGVPANASIRSIVEGELAHRDGVLPVFFGERFVGLVGLADIARVPASAWEDHTLREIMLPAASVPSVAPSDSAIDAFRTMSTAGLPGAPVVEDGELVGMLFASDIGRWVELHTYASKRRLLPA
jgi:Zn-dependent protease/CBS domain-containing protein